MTRLFSNMAQYRQPRLKKRIDNSTIPKLYHRSGPHVPSSASKKCNHTKKCFWTKCTRFCRLHLADFWGTPVPFTEKNIPNSICPPPKGI